jgi:hypothetical protein
MICSEVDLENKTNRQRESDDINDEEEQEIIDAENLKKKKLNINKFEVIEDSREDENDEEEVK